MIAGRNEQGSLSCQSSDIEVDAVQGDRQVPQRRDLLTGDVNNIQPVHSAALGPPPESPNKHQYQRLLKKNLLGDEDRKLNFFAPRKVECVTLTIDGDFWFF